MPQEYRRPTSSSARTAGASRRGKRGHPSSLDAAPALVSALPDVPPFPAPAAWGAGLCPPLQHRHPGGCLWLDAGLRPVGHCFAAPPGIRLPGWPGVRSWASAERLAPRVRLRRHAAPRFPRGLATARPHRLHYAPPGEVDAASFLPRRPAGNRSRVPGEEPTARPG